MPGLRRFLALAALLAYVAFAPAPIAAVSNSVVISQIYGGGGNSGATFRNDFIELHNRGTSPVNLTGWSVQYASAAGTTWQRTNLTNVTLQPGQYYLVQEAAGTGGTVNLPAPDAIGTIAMSATAGKVALVSNQTTLIGSGCPFAASVVDFVGFGSAATCFEGPGPTATLSNTTAALRVGFGCTDTDSNSADFVAGAPNPHNTASIPGCSFPSGTGSASPNVVSQGGLVTLTVVAKPGTTPTDTNLTVSGDLTSIGGSVNQLFALTGANPVTGEQTFTFTATVGAPVSQGPKSIPITITDGIQRQGTTSIALAVRSPFVTRIHDIQGNGSASPIAGTTVTTEGIVTGLRSNGFFIQELPANYDADPNSSEGVFVFTSSAPPAGTAVGNLVLVIGTVSEFTPTADPFQPPTTELVTPFVSAEATGVAIPDPVELAAADLNPNGAVDQLERLEGMRVSMASMTVVAPTGGSVNESAAASTSNGVFYGVLPGVARPFREPGVEVFEAGSVAMGIPVFDANPERIRVDSDAIGGPALDVTPGATVTGLVGPLDYSFRSYTIDVEPTAQLTVTGGIAAATPARLAAAGEFTVASANLERFFDTADDPSKQDAVLTPAAFNNRLNKVSLQIRDVMRSPDVIGVEEVENLTTLQAVAGKVNADTVAGGAPDPGYTAYLHEGNDIGGIDSGFLVKTSRVDVVDVTQEGLTTTFAQPDGAQALLNDRPPLILRALVHQNTGDAGVPMTVIVNHLRSLSGINDAADGARVRAKRRAQAEFLASLIQQRQSSNPGERIVSVGDYNAFQFNDGYVDSIGTITGTPTPAGEVTLASPDLVNPDLVDLVDLAPADQRYSFLFDGNAQELDHVLVTSNLLGLSDGLSYGRNNADFAETFRNDPSSPIRLSDHDPVVAYFAFPVDTTTTLAAAPLTSTFGEPITFTATVTANGAAVSKGAISFSEAGTVLGGPVALDGNGIASFTTNALTAGAHTVTAAYSGSGALQPGTADVTVVVNSAPTTTALVSSANPSGVGQSVTFSATVTVPGSGSPAAGMVTFSDNGTPFGTVPVGAGGLAHVETASLSTGTHAIAAVFAGANYLASSASVTQHVQPAMSINDVTVVEGNAGTTAATFTVSLSSASTDVITVDYATSVGTAKAGSDYVAASGTLTFSPGESVRTITVLVNGDNVNEPDEIFSVNLSNPANATIGDAQGIGTILNDDPVPSISINDVAVREPDRRTPAAPAVFTVRLANPSQQTVLVRFATADGTATAGTDYVATTGTLMFAPGETTQAITVNVLGNPRHERTETFFVNLSDATNATIGDSQGAGSIIEARERPLTISIFAPDRRGPGAAIVIVGTGFGDATSVAFNGTPASFTILSSNVIRAIVPAAATSGPITVTTSTDSATSAASFVVIR